MLEEQNKLPDLGRGEQVPDFLKDDKWFGKDLTSCWLDFGEEYRPPRWTLSHNGVPFANLGELHVITGKSGAGKTSFMSMLMAAILKGEYGGLKYELHEEIPFPIVLYIDTEQGKDDSIAIKNRVCTLAGLNYKKPQQQFKFLRLRDTESAEERWQQMLQAIWETKPNIVFIDGMLDIVKDYNDQVECQPVIRKCMKLATYYNASVWCVLHENPTFEKMVGTLGSILERKVTEAFAVRKHKQDKVGQKDKRIDRPNIYFSVEQKKARRYDQCDWDFEVINNAEGWGVPQEFDVETPELKTTHTPEEIQQWITEKQDLIKWPATRTDVYKYIFEAYGVTDSSEQKELIEISLRRRFFIEQTKEEMASGQKNPRLKLNEEIILPF